MLIDWFTVGAQLINFLVLVLLMKRFLYRPILDAMAARERRIATALEEAARKNVHADQRLSLLRQREDATEAERLAVLKKAVDEADERRQQLVAAARDEVSKLQARWHEAFAREKQQLRQDLTLRVQAEVLAIARNVLRELADAPLEEAIAHQFARQLEHLPTSQREQIRATLNGDGSAALVRSVFAMPPPARLEIDQAIRRLLPDAAAVRFETAADVLGGVELLTPGHKICWSIETYLESLGKTLDDFLEKAAKSHATD